MALTPQQCKVLGALVEPHATVPDRTLGMLVRRLAMGPREVAARLGELEASSPPLAELVADEVWAMQAWFPTKEGRRAYRESCDP